MFPAATGSASATARDEKEALRKLDNLTKRPAFTGVKAVKDGNVHAIWHQFYNNPYQFVAIQEIAKWLHPDLFKDLDPGRHVQGTA